MPAKTLFQKICDKEIPAIIVHEDDRCVAFRDISPQAPVHILIVPRQLIPRLAEATPSDESLLGHLLLTAGEIARREGIAESGFRITINNGSHGGETVPHLHVHLLGAVRSIGHPADSHVMKRFLLSLSAVLTASVHAAEIPGKPIADAAVLVHGIFEDGSKFAKMKARLEARGIRCITPKLLHQDGTDGLDVLAVHLKKDIDEAFGPDRKIIVIGFSMGRAGHSLLFANLGGADRCATFITISSPHHGTKVAYTYPSKGVIQMRPGSEFLTGLEATESRLGSIPLVSFRTPMDLIILPTNSSIWNRAENLEVNVPLHPLMLRSDRVLSEIEKRLLK